MPSDAFGGRAQRRRKSRRWFAAAILGGLAIMPIVRSKRAESDAPAGDELPAHLKGIDPDSADYWKEHLSSEQNQVSRGAGTERPFSGKYCMFKESGSFVCACCGKLLFKSDSKFDSGTGWPSFTQAVDDGALELRTDTSHGMVRTEVLCKRCGAHLGHVFDDGPPPSGKRFCINSVCLLHSGAAS